MGPKTQREHEYEVVQEYKNMLAVALEELEREGICGCPESVQLHILTALTTETTWYDSDQPFYDLLRVYLKLEADSGK